MCCQSQSQSQSQSYFTTGGLPPISRKITPTLTLTHLDEVVRQYNMTMSPSGL
jgi:hypothetical protein